MAARLPHSLLGSKQSGGSQQRQTRASYSAVPKDVLQGLPSSTETMKFQHLSTVYSSIRGPIPDKVRSLHISRSLEMFLKPTAFLIQPFPRPIKLTGPYPSQALSNTLVCINLWDTAVAFFHVLFAPETCARVDVVFSREASPSSRPRANQAIYFFSLHLLAPGNRCPQVLLSCFQPDIRWIPVTAHSSPGRRLAGGACIPYIQAHT